MSVILDINECTIDNGGCVCDPNTSNCISYCHNYPGSHNCSCNNGYKLDPQNERKCIGNFLIFWLILAFNFYKHQWMYWNDT